MIFVHLKNEGQNYLPVGTFLLNHHILEFDNWKLVSKSQMIHH